MARLAIVSGTPGTVLNTILGDPQDFPFAVVMGNGLEGSIGDAWDGVSFSEPPPEEAEAVKTWDLLQLYREFTTEERAAILAASSSDPLVAASLQMALATVVSGGRIRADDPDMQLAFGYLVSQSLITSERKDEILGV